MERCYIMALLDSDRCTYKKLSLGLDIKIKINLYKKIFRYRNEVLYNI